MCCGAQAAVAAMALSGRRESRLVFAPTPLGYDCHDRISNNDGKTTFSPTIAESRTSQDAQKRQRAFFRPPCVPNPKIAEIHLLRHCRDRDVMFGRRDTEHKAMEVYRYYRSLRDSLSDSRLESLKSLKSLESLKSLKSFRSTPLS